MGNGGNYVVLASGTRGMGMEGQVYEMARAHPKFCKEWKVGNGNYIYVKLEININNKYSKIKNIEI